MTAHNYRISAEPRFHLVCARFPEFSLLLVGEGTG